MWHSFCSVKWRAGIRAGTITTKSPPAEAGKYLPIELCVKFRVNVVIISLSAQTPYTEADDLSSEKMAITHKTYVVSGYINPFTH